MKRRMIAPALLTASMAALFSCGGGDGAGSGEELRRFPANSSTEVITKKNVSTDSGISRDGKGSLRIDVIGTQTIELYRVGSIGVENASLVYQAAIRTENLDGETFLELKCYIQSKGEFSYRNYDDPLSGTNDWTVKSTEARLRQGENPDVVSLNLYVSGRGTVWIDDIRLLKRPSE